MSSPLAGIRPVELPVSGTCDANGACTIRKIVRQAYWSSVYAAMQVTGQQAQWVGAVGNMARVYGQGANPVFGPLWAAPGGEVQIQVVGAAPMSPVSGTLWGIQADDPQDMLSLPAPTSASSLSLTGPIGIGGTTVGIVGNPPGAELLIFGTTQASFSVSPSVAASGVMVRLETQVVAATTITVTGRYTAKTYGNFQFLPAMPAGTQQQFNNLDPADVGAPNGIVITNNSNANLSVFALTTTASFVANTPQQPVYITQVGGGVPKRIKIATTVNAGATVNVLPATAGVTYTLVSFVGQIDTTTGGASITWEDTAGNFMLWSAGSVSGPWSIDFYGQQLAVGLGFQLHNTSAVNAPGVNGTLFYF